MYNRSEVFRVKNVETLMDTKVEREDALHLMDPKKIELKPAMKTLKIFGGKRSKLRPGDILGALTKEGGIEGKYIGKINKKGLQAH